MNTDAEVTGAAMAFQALALAALVKLIRLGHDDLLPEIEQKALETLHRSLERADEVNIDADSAIDAGRAAITGNINLAKAAAAAETAMRI